jgi:hypothetical protein
MLFANFSKLLKPPVFSPKSELPDIVDKKKDEDKTPEEKGHDKALEEIAKKEETAKQKIDQLANQSSRVLFRTKTIWPFTLFINELTVDETKINFVFREFFFGSGSIHSVLIKNVSDVIVESGIFLSKIKVVDVNFKEGSIEMDYLNKEEAMTARRIIQGLVTSYHQEIDLGQFGPEELVQKVEEMGEVKDVKL